MIDVGLHMPGEVTSELFGPDEGRGYKFATLSLSDGTKSSVSVFLNGSNAAQVLQALAEESRKILDFLSTTEVSLDQPNERNAE